jgi:hypothetical protein
VTAWAMAGEPLAEIARQNRTRKMKGVSHGRDSPGALPGRV